MLDDWIHLKLHKKDRKIDLTLPEGYESNPQDEDTLFDVISTGPEVKKVVAGQIVVVSFMSGMFRFKLPDTEHKSFAVKEGDIIGIVVPVTKLLKIPEGVGDARD